MLRIQTFRWKLGLHVFAMLAKNVQGSYHITTNVFDPKEENPQIRIIGHEMEHLHEADEEHIKEKQFVNNAKTRIRADPTKPIKRVYDEEVAAAHQAAGQGGGDRPPKVPDFVSVRTVMSRTKIENMPAIPTDVEHGA